MGSALRPANTPMLPIVLLLLLMIWIRPVLALEGALKIGIPQRLPGLTVNNGELVYNRQMAWYGKIHQCVENRAGFSTVYQTYPTPRLIAMATKGELDVIFPLGFDRVRDKHLTRSASFTTVDDHFIFITRPSSFADTSLVVAARLGTPQANYLKRQGYTNVVLLEDYARFGEMLELGRIDMAAVPHIALDTIADTLSSSTVLQRHVYTNRGVGYYFAPHVPEASRARINLQISYCVEKYPKAG